LRAVFWRGNLAVGGKGMHLLLPSTPGGSWDREPSGICKEFNGMRLVRRSLHCSVGGGSAKSLMGCHPPVCHSGLDPESRFYAVSITSVG